MGIGGGIVCDVTGYAASTYLRGLKFGFVASTLLAQVDAAVGGKNGVNWEGYKNMIGVFNQPDFVICDPILLRTLPRKEILSGMAEVVKHALIGDAGLFSYLEENVSGVLDLRPEVMKRLVFDSLRIKSSIVNRDEREKGERRLLNYGHTFGHALEKVTGVSHGEAVSVGLVMAAAISEQKGYLGNEDRKRIEKLLSDLGLPLQLPCPKEKLLEALRKDKKREGDRVHFVFLAALGRAVVEEISFEELEKFLSGAEGECKELIRNIIRRHFNVFVLGSHTGLDPVSRAYDALPGPGFRIALRLVRNDDRWLIPFHKLRGPPPGRSD